MASSSMTRARMSREDFKKARELEELRKSGAAPPELDEEGAMINPHIPQYIAESPWYLNNDRPGLKHQKASSFKGSQETSKALGTFTQHYQRGVRVPNAALSSSSSFASTKIPPGACTNCGATTHKAKDCCERPRKKGAALTGKDIMPDEHVQELEFTYDGKRDRWNGYDTKEYSKIIRRFEITELERKKKKLQELDEAFELEKQEELRKAQAAAGGAGGETDGAAAPSADANGTTTTATPAAAAAGDGVSAEVTDARRLRALRKQEKLKKAIRKQQKAASATNTLDSKRRGDHDSDSDSDSDASDDEDSDDDMRDYGEVIQKKDATARMTVRNLRIRENTAKYLLNLDLNSAHYDPKTRSMRDNPHPNKDPNDVMYAGDNFIRSQGETKDIQQLQSFVWESVERGNEGVHVQVLPSQAEKLFQEYKTKKEQLAQARKNAVLEKYATPAASAASTAMQQPPRELLVPTNDSYVEYDGTGQVVKGQEIAAPKTKYLEDVYENGHKSVWGSYWRSGGTGSDLGSWGYACCHQTFRHAICTGEVGKQAAAGMQAQLGVRQSFKEQQAEREEKEKASAIMAATANASAATVPAPEFSSNANHAKLSSSAPPPSSSSSAAAAPTTTSAPMETSTDAPTKSDKKRRRDRSSSRSSSSSSDSGSDSDSSSGSDSDSSSSSRSSSSSSSSSSGSDSDSDSDRRRRRHKSSRRHRSSKRSKRSRTRSRSRSRSPHHKDSKRAKRESDHKDEKTHTKSSDSPIKNSRGYNSLANYDDTPTEADRDAYMKSRHFAEDPMLNMPKDKLLDE